VPMLVVIANGNINTPGGGGYTSAGMAGFAEELLNNIVPFIEANYRVQTNAKGRALAGLSMGGGQAFYVGLAHKDKFASVGIFSTGLFGGISNNGGKPFNAEEQMPGLTTNAKAFNDKLQVLYISVGEQDPRLEPTKKAVADLKASGLKVEFASFPGGHEWQVWRKSLHDFAQRLFKP
jgi:enterochelin esterase-like enzyme